MKPEAPTELPPPAKPESAAEPAAPAKSETPPEPAAPAEPEKPKRKPKVAFTSPAEAGVDFAYQGEYGGFFGPWGYGREVGVQVVARGDGKFDGVVYSGGLPGAGWDRSTPTALQGTLDGALLVLSGDSQRFVIGPSGAMLTDASGRVRARLVKVKRRSSTLGAAPPPGAIVLFDGTSLAHFDKGAKMTQDGLLMEGAATRALVGDFQLHLEFCLPFMPYARGQGRANSGVYIQRRYEVQILDSFGLEGSNNECGALYRQTAPSLNMCLPPLTWQTFDIFFYAAKWNARGEKTVDAHISVYLNGVEVHGARRILSKTGNGKAEGPEGLPILLQDHGDPVRFRNIWLKPRQPLTSSPSPSFPLSTWRG